MKLKFQKLESFYEEEIYSIVESVFTEFLHHLFEKEEYARIRRILFRIGVSPRLPDHPGLNNRPPSKTTIDAAKIRKVKLYVAEHYGRTIRLKEVADYIGYNASAFSYFFKQNTGQCFTDYVIEFRLEKATRLLHETDEPVIEVGYLAGFNSPIHFNNAFKKNKGMTPGEYRKLCRRNE